MYNLRAVARTINKLVYKFGALEVTVNLPSFGQT